VEAWEYLRRRICRSKPRQNAGLKQLVGGRPWRLAGTDGNTTLGSNNTSSRIAGGVVSADYRFSPFTLAGFAVAGGGTNFSIANGLGSDPTFSGPAVLDHDVLPFGKASQTVLYCHPCVAGEHQPSEK
jgi:hypothetical protein